MFLIQCFGLLIQNYLSFHLFMPCRRWQVSVVGAVGLLNDHYIDRH